MINHEEHAWGSRLTVKPISATKHMHMAIHADVHRQSSGTKRDIRVTFTAPTDVLRPTDARTWMNAMAAILAEADTIADSYVPKEKAAKKAAKKK